MNHALTKRYFNNDVEINGLIDTEKWLIDACVACWAHVGVVYQLLALGFSVVGRALAVPRLTLNKC